MRKHLYSHKSRSNGAPTPKSFSLHPKNSPCPEKISLPTNIKEIIRMERNTKKAKVQVWRGLNFSVIGQAFRRTKDCVTHRESKSDFRHIIVPYSHSFLLDNIPFFICGPIFSLFLFSIPVHFYPADDHIPFLCATFLQFFFPAGGHIFPSVPPRS